MQVGSLVECIKAHTCDFHINGVIHKSNDPIVGNIYTIREIIPPDKFDDRISILLHELKNEPLNFEFNGDQYSIEPSFLVERFREIQPPMSIPEEIQEIISQPIKQLS